MASVFALAASAEDLGVRIQVVGGNPGTRLTMVAETPSGVTVSSAIVLGEIRETRLSLTGSEAWSVQGKAEGFWIAPVSVPPGSETVTVALWPASEFAVELQTAPHGRPLPRQVEVRLSTPASGATTRNQPTTAIAACPVGQGGVVVCRVPAGTWDVRAKSTGFVPRYLWTQAFSPGRRFSAGRWTLEEGTSLFGRVVTEKGPADPKLARVVIEPAVERDAGSAGAPSYERQLGAALVVNEWGYFQSDALAPGRYVVTARQAGFEDATQPVTMRPDTDAELADPIVLAVPLQLSVTVDPPSEPAAGAWTVDLMGVRQGDVKSVARGSTDETGAWLSPAVAPGVYTVRVANSQGSWLSWNEVQLSRDSRELTVSLDLVRVQGEVRIGDEALQARVWFGGRNGRVRVKGESAVDGRFEVVLPRSGKWDVDVQGLSRPVEVGRLPVDVRKPTAGGPAEVAIAIPDTTIHGVVTDVAGKPVEGAQVRLLGFDRPTGTVGVASDAAGEFAILGHPPGSYSIEARDSTRSSELIQIVIAEKTIPPKLELVLVERRQLTGKVVARSGPVAGAFVLGFPAKADGALATMLVPQDRTELDGSFELELPPQTIRVRVVVTIPGHPLAVTTVPTAEAVVPITVTLGEDQGKIEFAQAHAQGEPSADGTVPIVLVDGQALDFSLLVHWARANGARVGEAILTVDAMPPGSYVYCELLPAEAMLVLTGAAVPAKRSCSEGYLPAGGKLALGAPAASR
ncbi:MAG TPA: carboxypeptidase-like regulatory domain-containing protein [Thermoanaerobaculia bacterium]|nr:carboxypeptidase-like regulatory domain-containing protein [Thermoanaerobaculia bacterium]